jgi:beta-glucanase (GH16 family)
MVRSGLSRNLGLLTAAVTCAAAAAADFQLVHDEDFTRAGALDAKYWQVETGFHRNRELQLYTPGNIAVGGGVLRIEARREQVPNPQWRAGTRDWRYSRRTADYTSGSLVSREPLQFGRVEVVARTPGGAGVWPAVWLVHEAQGLYGEIDMLEAVGKHPDTLFAGVHYGRDPRTRKHRNDSRVIPGFEGRWHTHTLEWTPERIVVSLDGKPWFAFDPREAVLPGGGDPLRAPMRLRINLAIGGSWGGPVDDSRLPAALEVRSVRVWRWAPGAAAAASVAAPRNEAPAAAAPAPQLAAMPAAQPAPAAGPPPAPAPAPVPVLGARATPREPAPAVEAAPAMPSAIALPPDPGPAQPTFRWGR